MPLLRMIASFTLAATILVLLPASTATAQTAGSAAVYRIHEGRNELSLVERFSIFVEHSAKIRRVMDFDEEVITVQVVEGTPTQFRVYALRGGIATINVVDEARRLSAATMKNIRQNLFFAFIYNVLGVPVAAGILYPWFGILLSPMLASAAMAFSSVSVIANALRLRRAHL